METTSGLAVKLTLNPRHRNAVGFLTLLVSVTLFAGQQKVTRVAGAGCHSVGVAAAEE